MKHRLRPALLLMTAAVWLAAVAGGLRGLWGYANRAGAGAVGQAAWPVGSLMARRDGVANLVMFIHPMCPCSKASAEELLRLMNRCDGHLHVQVVAVELAGAPAEWRDSELIKRLRGIDGVNVFADVDGREARRFGARTSGQTQLYDSAGRLVFSGGITASRGHQGDNAGSDAIVALVSQTAERGKTPDKTDVFGCSLFAETNSSIATGLR